MSSFKPSRRAYPPVRRRPLPHAVALQERSVAIVDTGQSILTETPRVPTPMEGVALKLTMVFLFLRISFLHEFIASKSRIDLHILMLVGAASLLTAILSGKLIPVLRTGGAITLWLLFALCLCGATITSTWRGGSFPIVLDFLRTMLPLVVLIPAVAYTTEDLVKIVKTIGWAGITTIALGFSNKVIVHGRMVLANAPSIGDSNDYAAYLIFVFPFVAYLLFAPGRSAVLKFMGFIVIPAGLFQILSTGSRGGLIGVAAIIFAVLVMGRPKLKAMILIGVPTLALLALPLVPSKSVQRFESLFSNSAGGSVEATESSEARQRLLLQSIRVTFSHPLFGVGPGQFMEAESKVAKMSGEKGMWHETHNTYTQVSSECGIPAFLFFVSALGVTFVSLWKLKRTPDPLLATIVQVVFISMFGFAVCATFLSHAYDFPLLISCALSVAIARLLPESNTTPAYSLMKA